MKINKDGIQKFQSGGFFSNLREEGKAILDGIRHSVQTNEPLFGYAQNKKIKDLTKTDAKDLLKSPMTRFYQLGLEHPRNDFKFGGGFLSGGGSEGEWGNEKPQPINWLESKIPIEGPSFNETFANARKNKLKQFNFNGKTYTTDVGKTWDPNKGNVRENLRLRTVLDNDNLLIRDSTRIEPELGQQVFKRIDMTERKGDLNKRRKEVRGW